MDKKSLVLAGFTQLDFVPPLFCVPDGFHYLVKPSCFEPSHIALSVKNVIISTLSVFWCTFFFAWLIHYSLL
jgi:hypothetical protein